MIWPFNTDAWLLAFCWVGLVGAPPALAQYAPIGVAMENANNGIFDPSIEIDPATGDAWLAYSAVSGPLTPWGPNVETRLAKSVDNGNTWSLVSTPNPSLPAQELVEGVPVDGFWNHEVPSIVLHPEDPTHPWKLVTHRVFRQGADNFVEDQNVPILSTLEVREAVTPDGPWTLLVRLGSGHPGAPPIDFSLNPLGTLADTVVYTEPGFFSLDGLLYLSLTAIPATAIAEVVLLSSADGGATWAWVGPLLTPAHAAAMGYTDFDGSAIVMQGGVHFLLASPGSAGATRDGASVFQFSDLAGGSLINTATIPTEVERIPLDLGTTFGGQAEFDETATPGGVLMNQLALTSPQIFQIVETGVTTLPEPSGALGLVAAFLALATRRMGRGKPRLN